MECITNMIWLSWLCTLMVTKWSWVQTWLGMKLELYYFKSVVLEGIWEGKRERRGSKRERLKQGIGESKNPYFSAQLQSRDWFLFDWEIRALCAVIKGWRNLRLGAQSCMHDMLWDEGLIFQVMDNCIVEFGYSDV